MEISQSEFNVTLDFLLLRSVQDMSVDGIFNISGSAYNGHSNMHSINMHFDKLNFLNKYEDAKVSFVWGNSCNVIPNKEALVSGLYKDATVILCEDGFIRSFDTWCGDKRGKGEDAFMSCSTLFDTKAYYFDGRKESLLESMLNDKGLKLTGSQKIQARDLMKIIIENKISKYNHQPLNYSKRIGRYGKPKVLVVDQSYGDFSIRSGLANDSTFEKMLKCAIDENPGYDVIVKTHPDAMTGKRKGYYTGMKQHDRVFPLVDPINPYTLFDYVDKVYVCTTQLGLEALMAGKEVHTFGMPFYANWGLTIDDQKIGRRTNKRTIEELFYIFYCMYTHWCNPITGKKCSIYDAIYWILDIRDKYYGR